MENHKYDNKSTQNQPSIDDHNKTAFQDVIMDALGTGGLNAVGFKGHGKTRFLFCVASELMKNLEVRVLIWDSSDAWLYGFNRIAVFNVTDNDITVNERKSSDDIEKYQLNNWQLVKFALDHQKDLLFRMKTRNPSKRAFFVRTVINYLDTLQIDQKERTPSHENKQAIAYFLEEAQNIFSSRTTSSNDMAEFLSVFNEGRNFKESFFTACQRLNDFSKTIRTKQLQIIGKLSSEDLNPALRKLEKKLNIEFANMPSRNWLYCEKLFTSPEFKQSGKPYLINSDNREAWQNSQPKPKTLSLSDRIKNWLMPLMLPPQRELYKLKEKQAQQRQQTESKEEEEDQEMDDMFMLDPLAEEDP
jgi:hypothetical protein